MYLLIRLSCSVNAVEDVYSQVKASQTGNKAPPRLIDGSCLRIEPIAAKHGLSFTGPIRAMSSPLRFLSATRMTEGLDSDTIAPSFVLSPVHHQGHLYTLHILLRTTSLTNV